VMMASVGKYNLSWNYEERCATMFEAFLNIQQREDYSDVTLVTDDGPILKAHRVILGACSTFFGNIFMKTKVRDLCLYLPGVGQTDLKAILDFVYNGQADIPAESLDSFTKTAEQLRIKGLAEVDATEDNGNLNDENTEIPSGDENVIMNDDREFAMDTSLDENITEEVANNDSETQFDASTQVKVEMKDEDEDVEKTEEKTDDSVGVNDSVITEEMLNAIDIANKAKKQKCDLCDFEYTRKDRLKRHVAFAHTTIEFIKCTKCDFAAKDKEELKQHTDSTHKRILKPKKPVNVFPCDKCDYRARTSENLERHLKFIVHKPKVEA